MIVRAYKDETRWYPNPRTGELTLPSVTSFLNILSKPALVPWAVKEERWKWQRGTSALIQKRMGEPIDDALLTDLLAFTDGVREADRIKAEAAEIGTEIHERIREITHQELGLPVGDPQPRLLRPEVAAALDQWWAWREAHKVQFMASEQVVVCIDHPECQYGGTFDAIAKIDGQVTLLDYKSSKAIYPEMYLQIVSYTHAWNQKVHPDDRKDIEVTQSMIVRLPKLAGEGFEVAITPPAVSMEDVWAARRLWQWRRRMEGKG